MVKRRYRYWSSGHTKARMKTWLRNLIRTKTVKGGRIRKRKVGVMKGHWGEIYDIFVR